MVVCSRCSSFPSVLQPASPLAHLCIQMAGATKRLRRKTTVPQKDCSELMLLTAEWWMQFLLPVQRYTFIFPMPVKRLLCKAWREFWNQGFRIKLSLHQDHIWEMCRAAPCYGDLVFSRDPCNNVIYDAYGRVHNGLKYCQVSMPWNTFKRLRPILLRMRTHTSYLSPTRGMSFSVVQSEPQDDSRRSQFGLLLTAEWWVQFLLPDKRYTLPFRLPVRRLLCKAWVEFWDQGFSIKLNLHQDYIYELCRAVPCYDDLLFSLDSCNNVIYDECGRVHEGLKYCQVSMPWNTFKGLRPRLLRMRKHASSLNPTRGKMFSVHSLSFGYVSRLQR